MLYFLVPKHDIISGPYVSYTLRNEPETAAVTFHACHHSRDDALLAVAAYCRHQHPATPLQHLHGT